ncbi:hypothetical protein ACHAXS_011060 [Conticribra weissflogii]
MTPTAASKRGAAPSVLEEAIATTPAESSNAATAVAAAGTPKTPNPRGANDRNASASAAAAAVTPSGKDNGVVDLTAPSSSSSSSSSSPKRTSPRNNKRNTTAQAAEVTPAASKRKIAAKSHAKMDGSRSKNDNNNKNDCSECKGDDNNDRNDGNQAAAASLPSPPRLHHPSSPASQATEKNQKFQKLAPTDAIRDTSTIASADEDASAAPDSNTNANAARSSDPTPATAAPSSPLPAPKRRRTFHDQILYTMLASCKPYSLKSLAKATGTTVEALHHAMLSFLDKQLVLCKEFPSKTKGGGAEKEGKKLYWANPVSLAELALAGEDAAGTGNGGGKGRGKHASGGGANGVIAKEFAKLLATPREMQRATQSRRELERRYQTIREELDPLLAIPTVRELEEECIADEVEVHRLQAEIREIRHRIEVASDKMQTIDPHGRFPKRPPSSPPIRDPVALKRRINHMLAEYRARKRKCMDFVEELADAMEKTPKDVMGEKVLGLDTDEMEWGTWEDGGKVMGGAGKKKGRGGGVNMGNMGGVGKGRKGAGGGGVNDKENEAPPLVKIPSKYTDV